MNLNQNDINVRLQLAGQAFSEMSRTLADSLSYGRNCVEKQICELNRLSVYISILENYSVLSEEVLPTGLITPYDNQMESVNVKLNGVTISGNVILDAESTLVEASLIASAINSYQNGINGTLSAIYINDTDYVTVTGSCSDNGVLSVDVVPVEGQNGSVLVTGMTTGVCSYLDGEQCYTEAEVQVICNKISKITGIDFMPIGYSYIP